MIIKKKPRKTTVKNKRASLSSLIRKADTITSQYIRQKYADSAGIVKCVTCDTKLHWSQSHCAHFMERANKATRWLEENLHPACPSCNVFRKEYHKREYTLYIIDMYGREKIDEFKSLTSEILNSSKVRFLAEEAIKYYSEQLKELRNGD